MWTFISAWSFQPIHFSASPKIEDEIHNHVLLAGGQIYILLGIWFENFDFKKCFISNKNNKTKSYSSKASKGDKIGIIKIVTESKRRQGEKKEMEQRTEGENRNQIASDTPKPNHINNDIKCKWSK